MPAPAGFKTFVAGAVLSATSDVQVFLMDQVCTVWNDASARTSGLGSPAEGQLSYLKDTDSVEVYDGASWTAVGGTFTWTGSTANGLATYGSSTTVVAESTATYDGTTLTLTQSGGGLKMDGLNSSDANTLDDYEEGYFTATFQCGSGTITADTSADTCAYTKIGRVVTIQGRILVSAISSPSTWWRILGLPFTSATLTEDADDLPGMVSLLNTASDISGVVFGRVFAGRTNIQPYTGSIMAGDSTDAGVVDTGTEVFVGMSYIAT